MIYFSSNIFINWLTLFISCRLEIRKILLKAYVCSLQGRIQSKYEVFKNTVQSRSMGKKKIEKTGTLCYGDCWDEDGLIFMTSCFTTDTVFCNLASTFPNNPDLIILYSAAATVYIRKLALRGRGLYRIRTPEEK